MAPEVRAVHELRPGLRRHLTLLVSGGLVLAMGLLGLYAGRSAGDLAVDVHRDDRTALQRTMAELTATYVQLSFADVLAHLERDARAGRTQWSTVPGDPDTVVRLRSVVDEVRALDAGAALVSPLGAPVTTWAAGGRQLPAPDDSGWQPLRDAVLRGDGSLPLSGVLAAESAHPMLAMGVPVPLDDGSTGMLIGLWEARTGGLQQYVEGLTYDRTGQGYVLDSRGRVVAGAATDGDGSKVGELLALDGVLAGLRGGSGLLLTDEDAGRYVTTYAAAGGTGWTALTAQQADEFEGALHDASTRVEAGIVGLILVAGTGLLVLHRKREAALHALALSDDLTGVYNRRGWFAVASHELERARRAQQSRVLVFVDVDGLKEVNDVLGHREGDRAIRDAAAVLTAASRGSDVVGRLGGDEFVLLLGEGGDPVVAARRVREALQAHNTASQAGFELRLSLGVEVWSPEDPCTLEELVRRADAVMYVAKQERPDRATDVVRVPAPRTDAGDRSSV